MPAESSVPRTIPGLPHPAVSVVVPCLNESHYLGDLLVSIERQTYPRDRTELIFVDGLSTDSTLAILHEFAQRHARTHVLVNPARFVPHAMNIGIREARGDYIVRLDAHATYVDNYLETLISSALALNAENVGCVFRTATRSQSPKARAIAFTLAHPLGVGNSLFRIGVHHPTPADTVPFGCYQRKVFDRIGYYDERLIRNQDIELNRRLRRAGGRIFLLPEIGGTYFCRETFHQLWNNNWENGKWVVLTAAMTNNLSSLSIRHFVPLCFAVYLAAVPVLAIYSSIAFLPLAAYLVAVFSVTMKHLASHRRAGTALLVAFSFLVLHISYGLGSLASLAHFFRPRRQDDGQHQTV
ncbi:MAG: glycosyltransferase family 2 protein [bacterium]|nr:glycosyltransferase family 2 protein [bacterium]